MGEVHLRDMQTIQTTGMIPSFGKRVGVLLQLVRARLTIALTSVCQLSHGR
jgi:hypothetical protein